MLPHGIGMEELKRRIVIQCLDRHDGNQTLAARELGVNQKTIYNWLRKSK